MSTLRLICLLGESATPGPRGTECPEALHDWPLPDDYVSAHAESRWRLQHRWSQGKACAKCGRFGWRGVGELRPGQKRVEQ